MVYVLHGENGLAREEALAQIVAECGLADEFRDMNTEILEGAVSPGELRRACGVVPFLSAVRIVVARDVLSKVRADATQEIVDVLPDVAPTTHLIFDEDKTLPKSHPLLKQSDAAGIQVQHFAVPDARSLPGWVVQRTRSYGGQIEGRAAAILAQNIGGNLRLLDQEIQKLLLYVGDRDEITAEDVRVMVPYIQSADVIFQLVDAMGQRDGRRAATYLHRLLEVGEHPLGIFGMIVRQFRLLIQIRWLIDQHYPQSQIVSRLSLHPYVAKKVSAQADQFTPSQLQDAYRLLMDTDLAIKRGEVPADIALDMLVAQLTRL
ncbi:MAG: DNA polymerase III subunit delta [Anaerolineae bacterium]|nr:DNA polymerase III subunit delta [Anaerolineae bacterium]